jgi:hypothetical protein
VVYILTSFVFYALLSLPLVVIPLGLVDVILLPLTLHKLYTSSESFPFQYSPTHAAFPQPGHERAACFANVYRQLSVVQSRYLSRMLTAAAGLHTAQTGSGWITARHRPHQRFCTDDLLRIRPGLVCAPRVGQFVFGSFCS